MRQTDKIDHLIKNLNLTASTELDRRIDAVCQTPAGTDSQRLTVWSYIMHSKITKIAAAMIIIAALTITYHFTGSIDGASVVWADIVKKMSQVDHFHYTRMYYDKGFPKLSETGWYAHGMLYSHWNTALDPYYIDDGEFRRGYDVHNNLINFSYSKLKSANSPIDVITHLDWLYEYTLTQFNQMTPEKISEDFLVYSFEAPHEYKEDIGIDRFSFVVGKTTLLPIQLNIHGHADDDSRYSSLLFDYAQPPKPADFFKAPTEVMPPHGEGRLVFGGPEVEIQLADVPYLDKVIARLQPTKYEGPWGTETTRQAYELTGAPTYYLDIRFVTHDGTTVLDFKEYPILLNLGSKSSNGRVFPDHTKRRMTTVFVLKPTESENEFMLDINCWFTGANPYPQE